MYSLIVKHWFGFSILETILGFSWCVCVRVNENYIKGDISCFLRHELRY